MRDRVRSCPVGQERNTYLTVCSYLINLKDCTVGHTGTGASLLRSAKRFWTLDLYCFLFGKVASLMVEGRTPSALALSFTHILQMDFVKGLQKRDIVADCFTASTVSILPISSPKKMWVRIRSLDMGYLTHMCAIILGTRKHICMPGISVYMDRMPLQILSSLVRVLLERSPHVNQ